jgi:hypothetical protein
MGRITVTPKGRIINSCGVDYRTLYMDIMGTVVRCDNLTPGLTRNITQQGTSDSAHYPPFLKVTCMALSMGFMGNAIHIYIIISFKLNYHYFQRNQPTSDDEHTDYKKQTELTNMMRYSRH